MASSHSAYNVFQFFSKLNVANFQYIIDKFLMKKIRKGIGSINLQPDEL